MHDGPQCLGFTDQFAYSDVMNAFKNVSAKTNGLRTKAKEDNNNHAGIQLKENFSVFQLTFFSYDNLTDGEYLNITDTYKLGNLSTEAKEKRYSSDQIVDKYMIRKMFTGFPDVKIYFDNPVIMSRRRENGETLFSDLTHPHDALNDDYPDGTYGYSQLQDFSVRFGRPLVF
jgi:hypothetical protein